MYMYSRHGCLPSLFHHFVHFLFQRCMLFCLIPLKLLYKSNIFFTLCSRAMLHIVKSVYCDTFLLEQELHVQPLDYCAKALPTELSSPYVGDLPILSMYFCSGVPVRSPSSCNSHKNCF